MLLDLAHLRANAGVFGVNSCMNLSLDMPVVGDLQGGASLASPLLLLMPRAGAGVQLKPIQVNE